MHEDVLIISYPFVQSFACVWDNMFHSGICWLTFIVFHSNALLLRQWNENGEKKQTLKHSLKIGVHMRLSVSYFGNILNRIIDLKLNTKSTECLPRFSVPYSIVFLLNSLPFLTLSTVFWGNFRYKNTSKTHKFTNVKTLTTRMVQSIGKNDISYSTRLANIEYSVIFLLCVHT